MKQRVYEDAILSLFGILERMAAQIDLLDAKVARLESAAGVESLCEDEGCDHYGTPHVCVEKVYIG